MDLFGFRARDSITWDELKYIIIINGVPSVVSSGTERTQK